MAKEFETDGRIKFGRSVSLTGPVGIVTAEVFGGPIIRLQVGIYNARDEFLIGIGTNGQGAPLTSENGGVASWLFEPPKGAAYIKWAVQAVRSAGVGRYSVSGKVRGADGEVLAAGRFATEIPKGEFADDVVFDGVLVETTAPELQGGARL
jgi:hypothetical protein